MDLVPLNRSKHHIIYGTMVSKEFMHHPEKCEKQKSGIVIPQGQDRETLGVSYGHVTLSR